MSPFRSQPYTERCGAGCERVAQSACPRCQQPLCEVHLCDPYGCCEGCATDMYFTLSRAGRQTVTFGLIVATWSVLLALFHLGLAAAGFGVGFAVMLWGGSVARELAERSLRKELKHSNLLAGDAVGERFLPP